MDPFEHFDQEERSFSHLDEFGPRLAKEAAEILASQLGAELADLVGVVFEAGTAEFRSVQAITKQTAGAGAGFVGVMPRGVTDQILSGNMGSEAAAMLDEIVEMGKLPIVVSTKNGFRLGGVEVPKPWEATDSDE